MAKKNVKSADKNASTDIVKLILEDHKQLKKMIKTLKDTDSDIEERREVFEEFAPLLIAHAKPEEKSLYAYMKEEEDLREEAFEGDVEHQLADQMVEEAKRATDEDIWSARVKVLGELVEHHIKEEEGELLPDFKKATTALERSTLGEEFLRLKEEIVREGSDDAPPEREIMEHSHQ